MPADAEKKEKVRRHPRALLTNQLEEEANFMKALYTCTWRTKAEAASSGSPTVVPPKTFTSSYGAKQALVVPVDAGTVSYGELSGPNGLIRRMYNPAGA